MGSSKSTGIFTTKIILKVILGMQEGVVFKNLFKNCLRTKVKYLKRNYGRF